MGGGWGEDCVWTLSRHPDSGTLGTVAAQGGQSGLIWSAWPRAHTGLEIHPLGWCVDGTSRVCLGTRPRRALAFQHLLACTLDPLPSPLT